MSHRSQDTTDAIVPERELLACLYLIRNPVQVIELRLHERNLQLQGGHKVFGIYGTVLQGAKSAPKTFI